MVELNGWLAAFDRLLPEDRKRSIQLIEAYNGAVAESRSASEQINLDPFRLFSRDEIEGLVGDYRSNKTLEQGARHEPLPRASRARV